MLAALAHFSELFGGARPPPLGDGERTPQPRELRRAYHWACMALHPDRQVGASRRSQALAEELFKQLSAAYVSQSELSA